MKNWTFKEMSALASQHTTRKAFRTSEPSAASRARKRGWMDALFDNRLNQGRERAVNGHWTKTACIEAASKCATMSEFISRFNSAYQITVRNGWAKDVTCNLVRYGNLHNRYVYRIYDASRMLVYVGLTLNPDRRHDAHKRQPSRRIKILIDGHHTFEVVSPLLGAEDACATEQRLIEEYRSAGWAVLNVAKAGGLGGGREKWTKEALSLITGTCATRKEFADKQPGAYCAAKRRGLMNVLFARHVNNGRTEKQKPDSHWTIARLTNVAKKYKTRSDMAKRSNRAYGTAMKKGLLDVIFSGHENNGFSIKRKPNGYWTKLKVAAEASKYATRKEFEEKSASAYGAALKMKIMEEVFRDHANNGMSPYKNNRQVFVTFNGATMNLRQFAMSIGVPYLTVHHRIQVKGRTPDDVAVEFCIKHGAL